jgi:hypothetical protein
MLTSQLNALLRQLRSGKLEAADLRLIEDTPFDELVGELQKRYPVCFLERSIGRKRELGLAAAVSFEFAAQKLANSRIPFARLVPLLSHCVLASAYDNSTTELTATQGVRVRPVEGTAGAAVVNMGRGFKLDKTPDGWSVKPLKRRSATLAEEFLASRGWKFEALLPFAVR